MDRIDNIINEVIEESIGKEILTEGILDTIKNLLRSYKNKILKTSSDIKDEKKLKKKAQKAKKKRRKIRKTKGGGKTYYDYDSYEQTHRKIAKADADSIIDMIDQEKTDIAAVAREIFPDHTEEGAQSQLRKILNRERPLTKDIASKLSKMVSSGKIAIK